MSDQRGDWLLRVFASALDPAASRHLEKLVEQSLAGVEQGGVLVERDFTIQQVAQAFDDHKAANAVTVPPTDMLMMHSLDVPTGRIHHVMHFTDADVRMFSRVFVDDRTADGKIKP